MSDEIPVRSRSRCSICASTALLLRDSSRSSSSSRSSPGAITPPSAKLSGGSATIVFSTRSRTSPSSSTSPKRTNSLSDGSFRSAFRIPGILASDAASASTSRGFAASSVTRLSRRSRSSTPSNAFRNSSRATMSLTPAPTASSRASISPISREGRSSQARSSRLPMGVTAESMHRNKVTPGSVPAKSGSISSRLRTVTASSTKQFCRSYQPMRST